MIQINFGEVALAGFRTSCIRPCCQSLPNYSCVAIVTEVWGKVPILCTLFIVLHLLCTDPKKRLQLLNKGQRQNSRSSNFCGKAKIVQATVALFLSFFLLPFFIFFGPSYCSYQLTYYSSNSKIMQLQHL